MSEEEVSKQGNDKRKLKVKKGGNEMKRAMRGDEFKRREEETEGSSPS